MILRAELGKIARARLKDAEALFGNRRYDGAVYLCGYVVEVALKVRICRTLKWPSFPATSKDFQFYQSLRTHDLDVLLSLSGQETRIRAQYLNEWSYVAGWDPEVRYRPIGTATRSHTFAMIQAARVLLRVI